MRRTPLRLALACCTLTIACGCAAPGPEPTLLTAAERTQGRATTTYDEVLRLVSEIAERSPLAHETTLGESFEGRRIPLLVIADPPVSTPEQAKDSGKLIAYVFGGIHAGEACGKEALLHIARDISSQPHTPRNRALLRRTILLVVPLYNPDGDIRRAPGNRPGQLGPIDGMGQRANAQGLDLNRDHIKLEAPETRAQVRLLNTWDPHLIIDTHTTNGSHHRMDLTYAPPLNPSGDDDLLAFAQDAFLPEVEQRMRTRHGLLTFPYGNFNEDKTTWRTYSANPMFGGPYRGLRNRISILSEAHAYDPFSDRIRATELFVLECLTLAAQRAAEIWTLESNADRAPTAAGADNPANPHHIGIRHDYAPPSTRRTVPGWVEEPNNSGAMVPTGGHRDYTVDLIDRFVATKSVARPRAYLIPPGLDHVIENLRLHGLRTEPVERAQTIRAEQYRIDAIERAQREYQGHHTVRLTCTPETAQREIGPGWTRVPTAQPLGVLATYILEPESDGGLAVWNFFDDHIQEGALYPVLRDPVLREQN